MLGCLQQGLSLLEVCGVVALGEGRIYLCKLCVVWIPKHDIKTVHAQCSSQFP